MSHKASYWAITRDGLTPTQKLTLMALADCHNGQTGACHPSIERLSKIVNVSRSTMKRALDELERLKLIAREGRFDDQGQTSNAYVLNLRHGEMIDQTPVQNEPPPGSPVNRPPVHPRTPNLEGNREDPPSPSAKTPPRGSRLPEDWAPNADQIEYARQQGLSDDQIVRIGTDFADYWVAKPGKDGRKVDWNRTWQKWVRAEAERRPAARLGNRSPTEAARNAAAIAASRRMG
jgi:hypothetical protein